MNIIGEVMLALTLLFTAEAATLSVGSSGAEDYPSIQDAIDISVGSD